LSEAQNEAKTLCGIAMGFPIGALYQRQVTRWEDDNMEQDGLAVQDQTLEDLTLLLIYLTSWEEKVYRDLTVHRAWKGYLFEVLDALEEVGYINQTRRAKSVTLTETGLEHARELEAKFLGNAGDL
jgi:hypothetical protein